MALFGRPNDDRRAEAWKQWLARKHPLAIASFVLGLISFIEFGVLLVFGIAGIVLGVVAIVQVNRMKQSDAAVDGRALAGWGIALSAVSLVVAARFMYRWI